MPTVSQSYCFFIVSLLALISTAITIKPTRIGRLTVPVFFLGWMIGELAWFHIIWQGLLLGYIMLSDSQQHAFYHLSILMLVGSLVGLGKLHFDALKSPRIFSKAFEVALGENYLAEIDPQRREYLAQYIEAKNWLKPFSMRRPGVYKISHLTYGEDKRHRLDLYCPLVLPEQPCPVLLQIHGGGWVTGAKENQGLPLVNLMASKGWICVSINYPLSPKNRFPSHLISVKKAIKWIKTNIAEYGGDPNFIAVSGGSAGGHLCTLAALIENDPLLQPGFEEVDTKVQACVPFYGIYDFTDRNHVREKVPILGFLEDQVMPTSFAQDPKLWEMASPIANVNKNAPPTFVIHGTNDTLVFVEDARHFVTALRACSEQTVVYAELPETQHGFDIFHSLHTESAINAVHTFLEYCYSRYLKV